MFGKKKSKEPFIVTMTFSKETLAEIAKNYLKEELILSKMLKKEKFKYDVRDFMYLNFINDDNKIFKVLFQINIKDNSKERNKLTDLVHDVFECNDVEIENKKDFNFERFNLKHGLVKNDILIISKENKQEVKPRNNENNSPSINAMQNNQQQMQSNDYNFNNVVGINKYKNNGFSSDSDNLVSQKPMFNNQSNNSHNNGIEGVFGSQNSSLNNTNNSNTNPSVFGANAPKQNNDESDDELNPFKSNHEEASLFSHMENNESSDESESLFKKA